MARFTKLVMNTKSLLVEFEGLQENDPKALADLEEKLKMLQKEGKG